MPLCRTLAVLWGPLPHPPFARAKRKLVAISIVSQSCFFSNIQSSAQQPQLLLSSLCHEALGLVFLSPFDCFFPSNYLVVALPILVKGHKTNIVPLPCISKLLSTLAFHVFSDH